MKRIGAWVLALLVAPEVFAITFKDANELLTYFEFGEQSSEYCAQLGYPSKSIHRQWLSRHQSLKSASEQAIQDEMRRRGLTPEEQNHVVQVTTSHRRKQVQGSVEHGGEFMCRHYRAYLEGIRLPH
jgi:hypothetical protein